MLEEYIGSTYRQGNLDTFGLNLKKKDTFGLIFYKVNANNILKFHTITR
jgi:hypothetical protein